MNTPRNEKEEKEIVIDDYLRALWRNLHWIVLSALIGAALGYFKIRYTDKVYQAAGSLKIESDNNNLLSDIALFKDVNPKDKILTEAFIIRSRSLILTACDRLPIQISYFSRGRVVNKELYRSSPFTIHPIKIDSFNLDAAVPIKLELNGTFVITTFDENGESSERVYNYNDTVTLNKHVFWVEFDANSFAEQKWVTNNFEFRFNSPEALFSRISSGLDVSPADKGVSLLNISYKDINPIFASDFINELMRVYTQFDVGIKSQTATQTISFMEKLIQEMADTVHNSEVSVEQFKKVNNVFDLEIKGESKFKELTDLEMQYRMANLQLLSIESVADQIKENKSTVSLPLSIEGILDPMLSEYLSTLNKLNLEKISKSEKVTPSNPNIIELDKQTAELRRSILVTVISIKRRINDQMRFLKVQIDKIQASMMSLPTEEKQFLTLKRDLEVNQKVYAYLLQTKLEAAISRASIVSSARIIDTAQTPTNAVSPNGKLLMVLFSLLGVSIVVALVVLIQLFRTEIHTPAEIESKTELPVLGSIMALNKKLSPEDSRLYSIKNHRSIFGESVRSVRTNLQFLLPDKAKKIITFTSTISGEGKTFVSINVAGSLTLLGKKVVLIGCDLRKPQLQTTFKVKEEIGLSSYLAGSANIDEIVQSTEHEGFSIIHSGPIPPNPAELLNSKRMRHLLDEMTERYDYVILDTSPIGLVSDAICLMKMSDINIYVVKAGYSKLDYLHLPERIIKEQNIDHLYLLLNSYKIDQLSHKGGYYGHGGNSNYGYYHIDEDQDSKLTKLIKTLVFWRS